MSTEPDNTLILAITNLLKSHCPDIKQYQSSLSLWFGSYVIDIGIRNDIVIISMAEPSEVTWGNRKYTVPGRLKEVTALQLSDPECLSRLEHFIIGFKLAIVPRGS